MAVFETIGTNLLNAIVQGLGAGAGSALGIWLVGKGVIQRIENKDREKKP